MTIVFDTRVSFVAHAMRELQKKHGYGIQSSYDLQSRCVTYELTLCRYPTPQQIQTMYEASEMIRSPIDFDVVNSNTISFNLTLPVEGVAVITMRHA
jgi:hypothetical protein